MKILVLNAGSSSIKFKLFNMDSKEVLAEGLVEKIGESSGDIKLKFRDETIEQNLKIENHKVGLDTLSKLLKERGVISSFSELDGVGHRVVHGGESFSSATLIDESVIEKIRELTPLAPLHNPANLIGIESAIEEAPEVKQVAVFDTAFHQSMPEEAYLYAIPYELYQKYKVRRYGFHGTSHQYVTKVIANHLGKSLDEVNLVTLHLGNGASVTAIRNGKSVDTSMGLTPLEGLIMGTRSGDIDPAIISYLNKSADYSLEKINKMLNKESGLKGICGVNDVREIVESSKNGNRRATLAIEMFAHRVKKYIGAYMAILDRVDAIVFTGGIGEHSALIREKICFELDNIGVEIDIEKDQLADGDLVKISKDSSSVEIYEVKTDEELEIAIQSASLISNL